MLFFESGCLRWLIREFVVFFFGVFCVDFFVVDIGNVFCWLLGRGFFVIFFLCKVKISEDLGRIVSDKLFVGL